MKDPDELLRELMDAAMVNLVKDGGLETVALFLKEGLPILPMPLNMNEPEKAHAVCQGLCRMLLPEQVAVISDAWMKIASKEEYEKRRKNYKRNLHEDPDRIEAITICLGTLGKGISLKVQPYHRVIQEDGQELITFDPPLAEEPEGKASSAFFGNYFD